MRKLTFLYVALAVAPLLAQFETAEVLGTIRDAQGRVISGATVTLKNQATGIEGKTTTDTGGNYDFTRAQVGTYSVSVEATASRKLSPQTSRWTWMRASASI